VGFIDWLDGNQLPKNSSYTKKQLFGRKGISQDSSRFSGRKKKWNVQ
jgi:hypothetical protein